MMRFSGHVARTGEMRNYTVSVEKPQ